MMRAIGVCGLLAALAAGALSQEFEVVSVKPNKSGSGGSHSNSDRGMFTGTNLTLLSFVARAYGVKEYQVEGPDWLNSERYDIAAKFPEGLPRDPDQFRAAMGAMMEKMLVDRFKLSVHRDQKAFPVYELVAGKKGVKIQPVSCSGSNSRSNNTHYVTTCITMNGFAEFLSRREDLPVLDGTGLAGSYSFTLDWVPDPKPAGEGKTAAEPADGATLADALQDQLGLKLETRKAPIKIIVVDHVERVPTEN
jgi:uncharacterized protein (TIGR03435 family)